MNENQEKLTVEKVKVVNKPQEARKLWELYNEAFQEVNKEAPCRQSYTKKEFYEVLTDEDVEKFILRNGDEIVGVGLATNNLEKVSWISLAFYQKRFPFQFANRMIYYIKGIAVSRTRNTIGFGYALLAYMIDSFPKGSVGCFDFSEKVNKAMPGFVRKIGGGKAKDGELLDRQVYYVFEKGS